MNRYVAIGSGVLHLNGTAPIKSVMVKATGGMRLSGNARIGATKYVHYIASGQINLKGQGLCLSGTVEYTPVNPVLHFGGKPVIKTSNVHYKPSGSLRLNSAAEIYGNYQYFPIIPSIVQDTETLFGLSLNDLENLSKTQLIELISSNVEYLDYLILPQLEYLTLNQLEQILLLRSGLNLSGQANVQYGQSYIGNGTLYFSGSAQPKINGMVHYLPVLNNHPALTGSTFVTSNWVGSYPVTFQAKTAAFDISAGIFYQNIDYYTTPLNWLSANATYNSECQCGNMPAQLYMQHEFNKFGKLNPFITRNNISFPSTFTMSRNGALWQRLFHFKGVGSDYGTTEVWDLRFEWACTDTLNLATVAANAWQFSAIINRTVVETGIRTQSKMIFAFVPNICNNNQLSASFVYYGNLNTISTFRNLESALINVIDGIGLESGNIWNSDPTLEIAITDQMPAAAPTQFSLSAFTR